MADEKVSAFATIDPVIGTDIVPVVRSGDTTNYSATMDVLADYIAGGGGIGTIVVEGLLSGGTITAPSGTIGLVAGAGISGTGGTIDNDGVLAVGTLDGSVTLGAHMTTAGGSLDATGFASVPSAGIVQSNGTVLSAATISTGLTYDAGAGSLAMVVPVTAAIGGTGQTAWTANTLVYASATTTLSGLALDSHLSISSGTLNVSGFGSMTSFLAGANLTGGTVTNGGTVALSVTPTITDSTAKLILNQNASGTLDLDSSAIEQMVGADGLRTGVLIDTFGTTVSRGSLFVGRHASGTQATKAALANGQTIAAFGAIGADGTAYVGSGMATLQASVALVASETWTTSAHGTKIVLQGIATGGTAVVHATTLSSTGITTNIGTLVLNGNSIVPGGNFTTAGALTFSGAFPVTITATGTTSITLPTSGTLGTGSVTSIAETFTGGIISVAGSPITTAGTLALTVAGTSGGIPYFNSGTSWATSGALAANSVVIGGGAGAAPTGAVLPTGWAITSGTIVPSNTIIVGLSNNLADTITAGTYDLGPFLNGGTILNSYAHVVSGTIAFGVAIGQPGTYTDVTGLTTLTATSTTIDTIGTATAANVISAGAHAWLKVTTGAVGGDVFITVKVP